MIRPKNYNHTTGKLNPDPRLKEKERSKIIIEIEKGMKYLSNWITKKTGYAIAPGLILGTIITLIVLCCCCSCCCCLRRIARK